MISRIFGVFLFFIMLTVEGAEFSVGASEEDAQETVGCLFPMSGRGGLYGRDSVAGIQLAFEHIEVQPYQSPPIRVLFSDTSSKASKAARQVRNFVRQNKVRFICGVVNSSIALQVAQEIGRASCRERV